MKPRHPYRIFTNFYYKCRGLNASTTFHSHPQYEIYYFHSGSCQFIIGDRVIELQPGDLIIMNGMSRHCPKVDEPAEYVRTMFSFEPSLIQLFSRELQSFDVLRPFELLSNHHIRLSGQAKAECEELLERINRHYFKNETIRYHRLLMAFGDLLLFIHELCRDAMEDNPRCTSERERYVKKIIAYIERRYAEEVQLEDIAAELHMSRFHVMKLFREVTGLTVFDYLYKRRINQAKLLFFYKDEQTVTDVCYQVGFKHLPHFSRLFKKHVGLSPDQYRKKIRESGVEPTA